MSDPIWTPSPERVEQSNMTAFMRAAGFTNYRDLYDWSILHPDRFWPDMWQFARVVAEEHDDREPWEEVVRGLDRMAPPDHDLGPRWFLGARLNFAENLLRYSDDRDAIVAFGDVEAEA